MNPHPSLKERLINGDLSIIFYLSLINFAIHIVVNFTGGYGIFRDELYYLACSNHLDHGYVDHPPFSILVLRLTTAVLGDSLFAIRLIPAICSALTIWLTGLITLEMGGGRLATFIACLFSYGIATFAMMGYYSMNSLEILIWATAFYLLMKILPSENKNYWILLGVVLGIGLLNKIGIMFLGVGILVGLLLTEQRKWLLTVWPYLTGIIAFIFFLPYIIWNFQHDFAHLEFIRNASGEKYSSLNAAAFLKGQILMNSPLGFLVWFPGLLALFFHRVLKPFRFFGYVFITAFLILLVNKTSKDVYMLPAYTILWAAGGVWIEQLVGKFQVTKWALGLLVVLWSVTTVAVLPMVLPLMPVESYIPYSKKLGVEPTNAENKELAELHQFYADMYGWEEKARDVAKVFNSLSDAEKKQCAIVGSNYGRCAAIDYYGKKYGLPDAIGNHNNYWIWGPQQYTGEIMIIMGGELEEHVDDFEEVREVGISDCEYCMPYEDNMRIYLGRKLKADLRQVWSQEKHYE